MSNDNERFKEWRVSLTEEMTHLRDTRDWLHVLLYLFPTALDNIWGQKDTFVFCLKTKKLFRYEMRSEPLYLFWSFQKWFLEKNLKIDIEWLSHLLIPQERNSS